MQGGGEVRYKIGICLTVQFFPFRGANSLQDTIGEHIVDTIPSFLSMQLSHQDNSVRNYHHVLSKLNCFPVAGNKNFNFFQPLDVMLVIITFTKHQRNAKI